MTVEASTLDEACQLAVSAANESEHWRALDDVGNTFVDAIRPGEHDDAWRGNDRLAVPDRFTEAALVTRKG